MINRLLNRFADWACKRAAEHPDDEQPRVWGYTIADYVDGGPYLTRILFPRVLGFRPMLHHFHRPDGDRALHNHPWRWMLSIILRGSYTEERRRDAEEINGTRAPAVKTRRVRWFNLLTDRDYHRVTELHGEVWTLFVTGPRVQEWGFLEDPEHDEVTPWREYIDRRRAEIAVQRAELAIIAELETACGNALDGIGAAYGVRRKATVAIDPKTHVTSYTDVEADAEYRQRIRAAVHVQ